MTPEQEQEAREQAALNEAKSARVEHSLRELGHRVRALRCRNHELGRENWAHIQSRTTLQLVVLVESLALLSLIAYIVYA